MWQMNMEDEWEDEIDQMYRLRLQKANQDRYLFHPTMNREHEPQCKCFLYFVDMVVNADNFLSFFACLDNTFLDSWMLLIQTVPLYQ